MISKLRNIEYKEINRISPSQFYSMKSCAYKSVLAAAFEKKPLLPVSPNAYFGVVLHKILELIAKRVIKNEEEFNLEFDNQVKSQEEFLCKNGYDFFTPLQKNVKDYGMKKVLLKKHLRQISTSPDAQLLASIYSEKWYQSKDNRIAGKIDLIIENGDYIEIVDFKTGAILQDALDDNGEVFYEIKKEYSDQLKLYAHLYFENTGKYPSKLTLIDLAKQRFEIEFSPEECKQIYDEANQLLSETNQSIINKKFNANPTSDNCKYCLYRPGCSFFIDNLDLENSFNDVVGLLKQVVKYRNGNISLILNNSSGNIVVAGLSGDRNDDFSSFQNKQIGVFNLRREGSEFAFSSTKITMIYEF
jgi:CRISPR/Cas system-associated exonuclease Cas4 (RecB family)